MLENVPMYLQVGIIVISAGGTLFGVWRIGIEIGTKKNGYVTKTDCKANVKQMTASIEKLHEKTNKAITGISDINGYLRGIKEKLDN